MIRGNRLVDTRPPDPGRRRIGPGVVRPVVEGNEIRGMDQDLLDQREGK